MTLDSSSVRRVVLAYMKNAELALSYRIRWILRESEALWFVALYLRAYLRYHF
jgi:hypothetical protein